MPVLDPRVDAYIAKAAPFAQPILEHLRAIVHETCPDVEETLKWSMPTFMYKGMLCGMAAFKAHATFGFWKHKLIVDGDDSKGEDAMGSFGRITSVKDLPSKKVLQGYIKKAMKLNDEGVKVHKPKAAPKPVVVPDIMAAALRANEDAARHFEAFSPSAKREYTDWITEAKTEATREKRLLQAIEWISEGKKRNWKYENC